jgi:hypothetical protein
LLLGESIAATGEQATLVKGGKPLRAAVQALPNLFESSSPKSEVPYLLPKKNLFF